ncbi:DUF4743 domain-containing protein [Cardiobacteriaceae bacterium TAE3-ERU3]|nr:DUF4743 domain-containing protein [Cardiobacteriaceae bacterium TAE3-ERU3]
MSFLERIYQANNAVLEEYRPLLYTNRQIGLLWQKQIELLLDYGVPLQQYYDTYILDSTLDCETLSALLASPIRKLYDAGIVTGWRNELYPLAESHHCSPVALIERAAMPLFGGCGYGVHVNGLTKKNNRTYLWIARRAWNKPTDPGKLDQIAAGGMPFGISAFKNMQKESAEEAAISFELSAQAKAVSTSSYFYQVENGIRADVLFNYDLWLPDDFAPHNTDGEVAEFSCLPIEEVMEIVEKTDQFKFNANIVLIDLFIRHGHLTPEHKDYEELCGILNPRFSVLKSTFSTFR